MKQTRGLLTSQAMLDNSSEGEGIHILERLGSVDENIVMYNNARGDYGRK